MSLFKHRLSIRLISFVTAFTFIWSGSVWASGPLVLGVRDQYLAVNGQRALQDAAQIMSAIEGPLTLQGIFDELGIGDLSGLIEELKEGGISVNGADLKSALPLPIRELERDAAGNVVRDLGGKAFYYFNNKGFVIRIRNKEFEDDFYRAYFKGVSSNLTAEPIQMGRYFIDAFDVSREGMDGIRVALLELGELYGSVLGEEAETIESKTGAENGYQISTETEIDALMYRASKMPFYCPEISEVGRENLFRAVKGEYALKDRDYGLLINNLAMLKGIIAEWKSIPGSKEDLDDYIAGKTQSGFLKLDDISYDTNSEKLSLRIGDCVSVTIDIQTLNIISQAGLTFWPKGVYYSGVARNRYEQEMKDLVESGGYDGEANMGIDVFLSWEGVIEGRLEAISRVEHNLFVLNTGSVDRAFELKMQGEKEVERPLGEIPEEKYLQAGFSTLDSPDNITNRLNNWYYHAFGGEAFGKIDKEGTLEESNAKKAAEEFYEKLRAMDEEGTLPRTIVVQEWGAGDGYSASIFLDMMKKLDKKNNTNYYSRLRYILIDKSEKVIAQLRENPYLLSHETVIETLVMDVLDIQRKLPNALLVRTNLLLNSLPRKMVTIGDGRYYELYTRAYLDMEKGEKLTDSSGKEYGAEDIKRILKEVDIDAMRSLGKEFFNRIKWQEKYVPIADINEFPYGEYLKGLSEQGFQGKITLDTGALACIKNMLGHLSANGSIQISDAGTADFSALDEITGRIFRFYGAVYSPVNFHFLNNLLPISVKAVNQVDYSARYIQKKRIRLVKVLNIILADFEMFRKYFNPGTFAKMAGKRVLGPVSDEIIKEYGFNEEGMEVFKQRLADNIQTLSKWTVEKIARPFQETSRFANNYADAYIYWVYKKMQEEVADLLRKQKWLIPGGWQALAEDKEHNAFIYLCAIYEFEDAVDAIFSDMSRFFPGLMVFDVTPELTSIPATPVVIKQAAKKTERVYRVAINGAGRIGRLLVREMIDENNPNLKIAAITGTNTSKGRDDREKTDIQFRYAENIARLLMHDTVFGKWQGHTVVADVEDNIVYLVIDGNYKIEVVERENDPEDLPWGRLKIDIAAETSGKHDAADLAEKHLKAGARYLLLGAPGKEGKDGSVFDGTYVYGVNNGRLTHTQHLVSNASCTTNCTAPVVDVLKQFGIEAGTITTTHSPTASQVTQDRANPKSPERGRAAFGNIINTSSGVAKALPQVDKSLAGKFTANALRVPTINGSIVTLTLKLKDSVDRDKIIDALRKAQDGYLNGVLRLDDIFVSGQIIGDRTTTIVVPGSIETLSTPLGGTMVSMQVWYDNEAGYTNQYIRMMEEIAVRDEKKAQPEREQAPPVIEEVNPSARELRPEKDIAELPAGKEKAVPRKEPIPNQPIRLAINGAGCIALAAIRQLTGDPRFNLAAIAYHDIDSLIERLKWDTAFGSFSADVEKGTDSSGRQYISINGKRIYIVPSAKDAEDLSNLPWAEYDIDIVLDTTGKFTKYEQLKNHITAGAKKVILSAPFKDKDDSIQAHSFVPGVNSRKYTDDLDVISCASCTTNGMTPALKVLQDVFGIDAVWFTTTHAVTASQYVIDKRAKKPERGRSSKNTILTSTGAAKAAGYVLSSLRGRIKGDALRVDVIDGSVISLTAQLNGEYTPDEINDALLRASRNELKGILALDNEIDTSTQIIGRDETCVVSAKSTRVITLPNGKSLVKITIWYDNEWGYTNQLLRLAADVGSKIQEDAAGVGEKGINPKKMPQKPVYFFGTDIEGNNLTEGNASMKGLLGGKGANAAEMARLTYELDGKRHPIRVPPGFTITTQEAKRYFDNNNNLSDEVIEAIEDNLGKLEKATGRNLGSKDNPLLVSVRSGARISMPGMMDTVLNIGLNDETVEVLAEEFGNPRFAWDSYRRLIMMFGDVVLGLGKGGFDKIFEEKKKEIGAAGDIDLTVEDLKDIVTKFKDYIESQGKEFPQDVTEQLIMAVRAVFESSNNERAIAYRRINKIPQDTLSAVNVQTMVFGNLNDRSATGVAFTRNPATGGDIFYGEYLLKAQGEDVVAGIRTPMPINIAGKEKFLSLHPEYEGREHEVRALEEEMPEVYKELEAVYKTLEEHYKDMQDIEFTIQDGVLYLLQTRTGKRTAIAALNILIDLYEKGWIDEEEAVMRLQPSQIDQFLHPVFDPVDKENAEGERRIITKGLAASPGAAVGEVVFNSADAEKLAEEGRKVILVRAETSPEDIGGMKAAQGILTARGGMTSHAAVVARGMGKTAVVGAGELVIDEKEGLFEVDNKVVKAGDIISIDGYTGEVILGAVRTMDSVIIRGKKGEELNAEEQRLYERFNRFFSWVDEYRGGIRTNAETPEDVTAAIRYFGADGIGLARTEHMFFKDREPGENRIMKFRKMILTGDTGVLNELSEYQKEDFKAILRILNGKPVTIRLLDPPLHEFLPNPETEEGKAAIRELAKELGMTQEQIINKINSLKESNPMAGFRGDRLLMVHPEIAEMQVRAVFNAYKEAKEEGIKLSPVEIMIPLAGVLEEFEFFEEMINKIAEEEFGFRRHKDYLIGTMIEVPSAAITADEIAKRADFFSFGTNDLTQFTFKFSRDDAGNIVIPVYLRDVILKVDPFVTVDEVVGELVRVATALGRKTNAKLKVGICGEQGGDPESIENIIIPAGLNYASCSPYRVLVAKLASAQKYIKDKRAGKESVEPYDLKRIEVRPINILPVKVNETESLMPESGRQELTRKLVLAETPGAEEEMAGAIQPEFREILEQDNNAFIRLFNHDLGSLFEGIKDMADKFHEANPAMGNRGVRQALTGYAGIFRAQLRAICGLMKENDSYAPRIIVPLLVDSQEFKVVSDMLNEILQEEGITRDRISLGASIETPRAALLAGEIAKSADFIIFDTIGMTESVLAITKEDAGSFLPGFVEKGIYETNPLETIPQRNVGKFIRIAVQRAREAEPDIPIYRKIEGKIGGKPSSSPLGKIVSSDRRQTAGIWEVDLKGGILDRPMILDEAQSGRINQEWLNDVVHAIKQRRGGRGIFSGIDVIRVVDNLGVSEVEGKVPYSAVVKDGDKRVLLLDVDAFSSKALLELVLDHEFVEGMMALLPYKKEAVRELTSNFLTVQLALDKGITEVGNPNNLDPDNRFLSVVEYIQGKGITEDRDIIALLIDNMRTTPYYRDLFEKFNFTGDWEAEVDEAEDRFSAAVRVFNRIASAEEMLRDVRSLKKEAGDTTERFTKLIRKVKMISSLLNTGAPGKVQDLVDEAKFIRLDIDELAEVPAFIEWIKAITENMASPFIFYSESQQDVRAFVTSHNLKEAEPTGELSQANTITLIDPAKVKENMDTNTLYLALPYSETTIYLAAEVVSSKEGELDPLVKSTIKALFETLLGREVTDEELADVLFKTPWDIILPEITKISLTLDAVRTAVRNTETSA